MQPFDSTEWFSFCQKKFEKRVQPLMTETAIKSKRYLEGQRWDEVDLRLLLGSTDQVYQNEEKMVEPELKNLQITG